MSEFTKKLSESMSVIDGLSDVAMYLAQENEKLRRMQAKILEALTTYADTGIDDWVDKAIRICKGA
jgi:hypothetical protein